MLTLQQQLTKARHKADAAAFLDEQMVDSPSHRQAYILAMRDYYKLCDANGVEMLLRGIDY